MFVDYHVTEEECLHTCAIDKACLGVIYYSPHGGACWIHNISTVCLETVHTYGFTLYQKLPCLPGLGMYA